MIPFERFRLQNGMRILINEDAQTPLVSVCLGFDVGSRDELPNEKGLAHLFEHLMFTGTPSVPNFDVPLQRAGGEGNAFTNTDATVYHVTLPAVNLETALWLEADRLQHLSLNSRTFNTQKKVVIEEFKETCLEEPYGDAWHLLSALAYETHPYRIPVIGETPEQVQRLTLAAAKDFFARHYTATNAVLVIAGGIQTPQALALAEQYFGDFSAARLAPRNLPIEASQAAIRRQTVQAEVPVDTLYFAFHNPGRLDERFYAADLLSDVLSSGRSALLQRELVQRQQLFTDIDAYITATNDPGLLVIEGKLALGVSADEGEAAVWQTLRSLEQELSPHELQKAIHKAESGLAFSETTLSNRALSLVQYELLGDASIINEEVRAYAAVTAEGLKQEAIQTFREENAAVLRYLRA